MVTECPPVVGLRWLAEGKEDEFKDLVNKPREDLSLAYYSDDELGNAVYMKGDLSRDDEARLMIAHHQKGLHYTSRIAVLTAAKERFRWLSRKVAVLEGRYPGIKSPAQEKDEQLEKIRQHLGIHHGGAGDTHLCSLLKSLGYPKPTEEELRGWEAARNEQTENLWPKMEGAKEIVCQTYVPPIASE